MMTQKNLKTRAYSIVLLIIVLIFYYFKLSSVTAGGPGMILILYYYSFKNMCWFCSILKMLVSFSGNKHVGRVLLSINETKNKSGTVFFEKIFIFEERALTISLTSFAALYLFLFLGVVCNRYLVPCIHIISHSK